jgi:hypothetical protein
VRSSELRAIENLVEKWCDEIRAVHASGKLREWLEITFIQAIILGELER